MTLPIVTERLTLRRYTSDDTQDVLELVSHPSVAGATPEIEATKSGVLKYIDKQNSYQPFEQDKCFDLAIERRADGKVIGLLSLVNKQHHQGEIGYALGVEYRGQGFATEATRALMSYGFATLDLHRIQANTDSGNPDSWKVMERLGMRREGCLKEATHRDGNWLDVLNYAILVDEWRRRGTSEKSGEKIR
jgi:RimJ/RimL family protein N-acetyltransferase